MTAAPKLATLAEVREYSELPHMLDEAKRTEAIAFKCGSLKDVGDAIEDLALARERFSEKAAKAIPALCATIEHLASALQAITDAGGTAEEIVAARALLAEIGATP